MCRTLTCPESRPELRTDAAFNVSVVFCEKLCRMNPLRSAWYSVARFFTWLFLVCHGHRLKSAIFVLLWEPRLTHVTLRTFTRLGEITTFLRNGSEWKADGWREGWDAVHSPQYIQSIFDGSLPWPKEGSRDCDDHARFAAAAIRTSIAAGTWKENGTDPHDLAVMWFNGWTPGGHVVVVCRFGDGWRWCDYVDRWSPVFSTLGEVAADVRSSYAPGSFALAYCLQNEMRPIEVRRGQ